MSFIAFLFRGGRRKSRRAVANPIIDPDTLRLTALQRSWQRDHQVAKRRLAWRWSVFWGWKYGRKPAAVFACFGLGWLGVTAFLPALRSNAVLVQAPEYRPSPALPATFSADIRVDTSLRAVGNQSGLMLAAVLKLPPVPTSAARGDAADSSSAPTLPLQLRAEGELSLSVKPASSTSLSSSAPAKDLSP